MNGMMGYNVKAMILSYVWIKHYYLYVTTKCCYVW